MMSKRTRTQLFNWLENVNYKELNSFSEEGPVQQAPSGVMAFGHVRKLASEVVEGYSGSHRPLKDVYQIVAKELSDIWIHVLNIYPCSIRVIAGKIQHVYGGKKKSVRCFNTAEGRRNDSCRVST